MPTGAKNGGISRRFIFIFDTFIIMLILIVNKPY